MSPPPKSASEIAPTSSRGQRLIQHTESVLQSLRDKDYVALHSQLPWFIRAFLSVDKLKNAWSIFLYRTGQLESYSSPQVISDSFLRPSTKSLLQFQQLEIGIVITFTPLLHIVSIKPDAPINLGLTPPWTAPEYVDQSSFTETAVKVQPGWIVSDGSGFLTLPKKPGPHPAVILIPGTGIGDADLSIGSVKVFKDLASGLATQGIVVLRLDKPLLKVAVKQLVTKNLTQVDEYITPNIAGISYLATHPQVDKKNIFVLGISFGGRVAPRLCSASPVPIKGIISLAGTPIPMTDISLYQMDWVQKNYPRDTEKFLRERKAIEDLGKLLQDPSTTVHTKIPTNDIPELAALGNQMSYLLDDIKHKPVEIAQGISDKVPMLFLQGKEDIQVRADVDFQAWREGLTSAEKSGQAEFKIYDGLNHGFIRYEGSEIGLKQYKEPGHVDGEVVQDVVNWIAAKSAA